MGKAPITTTAPTGQIAPFGLRMMPELREKIEEAARQSGRSMNAEVVARIEASFSMEEEAFKDGFDLQSLKREVARLKDALEAAQRADGLSSALVRAVAAMARAAIERLPAESRDIDEIAMLRFVANAVIHEDIQGIGAILFSAQYEAPGRAAALARIANEVNEAPVPAERGAVIRPKTAAKKRGR